MAVLVASFISAVRNIMYFPEDRLELAADVLKLQEKVFRLKCRKPKTEETRKQIDEEIKIAKQKYEEKKYELLIMCSTERFVEDEVALALLGESKSK